jgi:hypothetical protein
MMKIKLMRRRFFYRSALLLSLLLTAQPGNAVDYKPEVMTVLERYLRAVYARDFREAYNYVSAHDQRLKDVHSYSRDRGSFTGFTLEAARTVASSLELVALEQRLEQNRATVKVKARVPDATKLNSLLHDWDSDRLERLSGAARKSLLETVERQRRDRNIAMVESEETFELVREADTWKIFLNWAGGVKLAFQPSIPAASPVEMKLQQTEVQTRPGQVFRVSLKIKNTSKHTISARIGHLVDPHDFRDYLDLVDCGFILPVRLAPGKEEEFITTYLLRGSLPDEVRRLNVTYAVTSSPLDH